MIKKVVAAAAATGGLVLAGAGLAVADSGAQGAAVHSPGILSGNVVQAPVDVSANVCGNTVSVVGLLNPAFGNTCINK
ncbi:chaplin ChpH [Streptomyces sp. UG1]|uniref:chaplin ChpH n=1 Tax=Streptomyces sp. UG1 TaxID=3417652 RepID=UPI003CECA985